MKLSIIIVNFNTQKLLEDCLTSIKKYLKGLDYEVIVVDNASDNFLEKPLNKIFTELKIIVSNKNLGFAKANNLAAKHAKGKYLWLLNSDTELSADNNIDQLVSFLENNSKYAAASPLVLNKSGRVQADQYGYFPKLWRMVLQKVSLTKNKPWLNANYLPLQSRDIDWVSGAAMMVNADIFRQVGSFNEEYFLYYEDIDLCQKFNANNYKVRFIKEAKIIHYEGASSSSEKSKKQIAYTSQDIYFKRWGSPVSRFFLKTMRSSYTKKWQSKK